MRVTRLCTLCSVSKMPGPLAKSSLSISALPTSNILGNPKDPQGNGFSTALVQEALWGWGRDIKYLGTKYTPQPLCFCSSELTGFVETFRKGGVSESLTQIRKKKSEQMSQY